MDAPPLPSRPVSSRPHWTIAVSREETLTVREKFRAVSWRQPNHKPSTTKIVARAKSVWDRYVTPDNLRHPSGVSCNPYARRLSVSLLSDSAHHFSGFRRQRFREYPPHSRASP